MLDRGGAIAGRVLDHEGDPLVRAQVSALQRRNLAGTWQLMSAGSGGSASTDDRGRFRLFGLPPGEYYVVGSYLMPGPTIESPPSDHQPKIGYAPTFYPSSNRIERARKVTVRAGRDTVGIDVSLLRAKLGSVSGRAIDAAGNPLSGARGFVSLAQLGEMTTPMGLLAGSVSRRDNGTFVMSNVPPGRYMLIATAGTSVVPPGGPREGAYKPVVVDGDDIVVDIQTNTGATISGRVVIRGSTPGSSPATSGPLSGVRARVWARPIDLGPSMRTWPSVRGSLRTLRTTSRSS